jgi:ATP-dependent Clp protease ATP-binding subunit ClpA
VKTPALKAFGRDLTELARKGEMDPVIGRKNEIAASSRFSAAAPRTIPC